MNRKRNFLALACIVVLLTACGPSEDEVNAATTLIAADIFATQTAMAPTVTHTDAPTATATATNTPSPTNTTRPSETPTQTTAPPTAAPPTAAPPTVAPPTAAQSSGGGCTDSSGGRHKVRVENKTGGSATMYFYGPENTVCTVSGGVNIIYLQPGVYSVTGRMCGADYDFGSGVINNTWYLTLRC